MKLRRPSPAMMIAIIALIAACTGTAFAATIITSSSQIKNGVVTSGDVKNGSLRGVDLRKSTITESRLSAGVVKKLGRGVAGGGDTTAYEAVRKAGPEGQPADVVVKVATLTVPAGAYTVNAKTVMTALPGPQDPISSLVGANGAIGGRCRLDAAGVSDESLQIVVMDGRQTPATLSMQMTRTVGAPSDFTLECSAGLPFRLSETSIIAQRASNVVLTTLAP